MSVEPSPHLVEMASTLREGFDTHVMARFGKLDKSDIEIKGQVQIADGSSETDTVTTGDKAMQRFVEQMLAVKEPDATLLGEENASSQVLGDLKKGKKRVLDPIDGTAFYGKGQPGFGSLYSEQQDGVTNAAFILRTYANSEGRLDNEIIMGDDASGVWHSPAQGKPFVRLLPFSERDLKSNGDNPKGIITARYFNKGLLKNEETLFAALGKSGDKIDDPGLGVRLEESGSAVNLWADLALGKIGFIASTPTRPWDNYAGAKIVTLLGGVAKSMDTAEDFAAWRIDGGIIAALNPETMDQVRKALFLTETKPMGHEPCRWDLLLEPTKERLKNLNINQNRKSGMESPMPNTENDEFKILDQKTQYEGYVSVSTVAFTAKSPDGTMAPPAMNTVVNVKNGITAVLYDPKMDKVLLTNEFRVATVFRDEAAWAQIAPQDRPSGRLLGCVLGATKPGEEFEATARREAKEESGVEIKRAYMGPTFFIAGSIMPNFVTAYALEFDSTKVEDGSSAGLAEEEENIAVQLLSLSQLEARLDKTSLNETMDATSQTAISWFLRKQPAIKAEWTQSAAVEAPRPPMLDKSHTPAIANFAMRG